jgi:hypothetical protein
MVNLNNGPSTHHGKKILLAEKPGEAASMIDNSAGFDDRNSS